MDTDSTKRGDIWMRKQDIGRSLCAPLLVCTARKRRKLRMYGLLLALHLCQHGEAYRILTIKSGTGIVGAPGSGRPQGAPTQCLGSKYC